MESKGKKVIFENAETDIIFGIHSIKQALLNPNRFQHEIHATVETLKELKNDPLIRHILNNPHCVKVITHADHQLQQLAKEKCDQRGFHFSRMPSKIFMESTAMKIYEPDILFDEIYKKDEIKILCLDQVTDVQNAAAILRTCAFFQVDYFVISQKNPLRLSPGFYRTSSGGAEHVGLVRTSNLARLVRRLQDEKVMCVGFSEKGEAIKDREKENKNKKICLIVGAEDKGLSHSVERILEKKIALKGQGKITSLNVSVATALAMSLYFS